MTAPSDQQQRLEELHQRLAAEVRSLCSGADWTRWLDASRRFHRYSFNNVLLICAQRPDASMVAGFQTWKGLGRRVNRGERGIQILAPVHRRTATTTDPSDTSDRATTGGESPDAESGNGRTTGADVEGPDAEPRPGSEASPRRLVGWRVAHVWDIAQTSGDPVPNPPRPVLLEGQAPPGLWAALACEAAGRGFTVERGECDRANGFTDFTAARVRVRDDVDDAQAVKTLAHELGHILLHSPGDFPQGATAACRGLAEVEAESLAYLVAADHGLDTGDYTFSYVATWADGIDGRSPQEVVEGTGGRVLAATRPLLDRLTEQLRSSGIDTAPRAGWRAMPDQRQRASEQAARALEQLPPTPVVASADGDRRLDQLDAVHRDAAAFLRAGLVEPGCVGPRDYLAGRGLGHLLGATRWEVGYASAGWTTLTDHLQTLGYSDATLVESGLVLRSRRGGLVDRFRDRLMVGIHDGEGRLVGFIGRAGPGAGGGVPKYLNSPRTPAYDKSALLLGLGEQGERLASGATPVLVEGPLDVLAVDACNRPGLTRLAPVAPCGTALTTTHAAALGRYTGGPVVVAFDSDTAGTAAAARAYPLLAPYAHPLLAAKLPPGMDPADFLSRPGGVDGLRTALSRTRPLADLVVDAELDPWSDRLDNAMVKVAALRAAAPAVAGLHPREVAGQAARLSSILDLGPETISRELADAASGHHQTSRSATAPGCPATPVSELAAQPRQGWRPAAGPEATAARPRPPDPRPLASRRTALEPHPRR